MKEKFLQMDPVGVSLVMGGIVTFILALEAGGQKHPWDSSMVIGLLVGFVAILVAFVAWEIFNGERSMIPPRLFRERTIWQPAGFIFFYGAGYIVLLYYLPIYFQSIDNRSAINSGVLNLPLVLSLALGSTVSGIVVSKTGLAAPFMVGGAVMATVSTGLLYTFDIGTGVDKWIGYQILYGGSVGLGFQMGINTAQANLKTVDMSSGTGVIFCKLGKHLFQSTMLMQCRSFPDHRWRPVSFCSPIRVREPSDQCACPDCARCQPRGRNWHWGHADKSFI